MAIHQGHWVNENSTCLAVEPRAKQRLQAESAWLNLYKKNQLPIHIFRLAGIYGPQRNALEKIHAGKNHTIYKADQVFSRIHVEDISHALHQSIQQPTPHEIFNLCDDYPAPMHEVDQFAATLLNKPPLNVISFEEAGSFSDGTIFFFK